MAQPDRTALAVWRKLDRPVLGPTFCSLLWSRRLLSDCYMYRSVPGRSFAAVAASQKAEDGRDNDRRRVFWRRVARIAKIVRVPFVVLTVYFLGYEQGIVDYSRDPSSKQRDLLLSVVAAVGCQDLSNVFIQTGGNNNTAILGSLPRNAPPITPEMRNVMNEREKQLSQVSRVGEIIVAVAKSYVNEQLTIAKSQALASFDPQQLNNPVAVDTALLHSQEFQQWSLAKTRLEGSTWQYILIDAPIPNAFVSEIMPQKLFITTSLLSQHISNPNELALVLGHEISHLILGHTTQGTVLKVATKTLEVLLLSLDPTEGLISLTIVATLATLQNALLAAHSRSMEIDADSLGILLAARACYDTKSGAHVFHKMSQSDIGTTTTASRKNNRMTLFSFLDTHPPSNERHLHLLKMSEDENPEKYSNTYCRDVKKSFWEFLRNA